MSEGAERKTHTHTQERICFRRCGAFALHIQKFQQKIWDWDTDTVMHAACQMQLIYSVRFISCHWKQKVLIRRKSAYRFRLDELTQGPSSMVFASSLSVCGLTVQLHMQLYRSIRSVLWTDAVCQLKSVKISGGEKNRLKFLLITYFMLPHWRTARTIIKIIKIIDRHMPHTHTHAARCAMPAMDGTSTWIEDNKQ